MPYLVNGQLVSEELIHEELGRIGRVRNLHPSLGHASARHHGIAG
jgi:hypothetical protein